MIIKWTNKFSGETGFVKSINKREKHFDNTFNKAEARRYASVGSATQIVNMLMSFGEGENNNFEIVAG